MYQKKESSASTIHSCIKDAQRDKIQQNNTEKRKKQPIKPHKTINQNKQITQAAQQQNKQKTKNKRTKTEKK